MSINIRRDNDDPFYRYKMPPIQSKTEGRGNGVKTAVLNLSDVARALTRPPSYLIKYFGFELGAQTSINEEADRYLINGIHESSKLQDTLDGFITKFVLCNSCKNPETDFIIHKNGIIDKDCKACGAKTPADIQHKLSSFIVKNPPATTKSKKKGMANAGASTKQDDEATAEDQNSADLTTKINAEASVLPAMRETNDEDEQWSADVSEEAVKARMRDADRTMASLSLQADEDQTPDSIYDEFGNWVLDSHPSDVEIYKRMNELNIHGKPKAVQVLAQCLFSTELLAELPEHQGLLSKVVTSAKHEKSLLGGLERFIGLEHPELISSIPNILFKLYDADLLSEDVAERWGTKASKRFVPKDVSKKVRRAAKPFIDWLEEAESDSDESDSE